MNQIRSFVKTISAVTVIVLIVSALAVVSVSAQTLQNPGGRSGSLPAGVTPDITLTTEAYMSIRPNPVGVGQTFLVNLWLHPPIHVSRLHRDFTVTIEKPDGTTETIKMDCYQGDTTAWFEYVADQRGKWRLKFDFLGTYYPAGIYTLKTPGQPDTNYTFTQSAYYKPSTTGWQELTVQEEQVISWPAAQLPSDYWTRPVQAHNREWWTILGNYPWRGTGGGSEWEKLYPDTNPCWSSQYNFIPWVQAPNTAHIVWKRQEAIRGIIGGDMGPISLVEDTAFYPNLPQIIYAGRAYQSITKVVADGTLKTVWQCYDLRTGEVYWERTDISQIPTLITYTEREYEVIPGETAFRRGLRVNLLYVGGGRYIKYDPWNGNVAQNVSIAPFTTGTLYRDPYFLTVQDLGAAAGANRYRLINWSVVRFPTSPVTYGVQIYNNISWPISSLPSTTDFNFGVSVYTTSITHPATQVAIGQGLMGISLIDGSIRWNVTTDLTTGLETFFSGSTAVADHGRFAVMLNTGQVKCWDLRDGKVLWTTPITSSPWGTFGAYHVQSAYGLYFSSRYDGVHAIDWKTGKIVWSFRAVTPYSYETPYQVNGTEVYSFHGGGLVADGKLYVAATEHTPSQPTTRGWRLYCLNATTGEKLWDILCSPIYFSRSFCGVVSDGYLLFYNEYDGYKYVFGKGKSQTTISVSQDVVTEGNSVMIKGTVLDMSPAQPGTPCVAKESMNSWLEYIHMQMPIPAEVKGIPVSLDAVDPNGNFVHIGDVVTDGMSGTFGFTWKPEIPGQYKITATFMGDDSYGSSYATTYVSVTEAPPATPTPEPPQTPPDYMPMLYAILGCVIVAIITGAVAIILVLRKR